jgi:hypothetical protein
MKPFASEHYQTSSNASNGVDYREQEYKVWQLSYVQIPQKQKSHMTGRIGAFLHQEIQDSYSTLHLQFVR